MMAEVENGCQIGLEDGRRGPSLANEAPFEVSGLLPRQLLDGEFRLPD